MDEGYIGGGSMATNQVKTGIGKYGVKRISGDQKRADRANTGGAVQIVLKRRKQKSQPTPKDS